MFTGLVETVGTVTSARRIGSEMDVEVDLALRGDPDVAAGIGDSIALSGVCCTIVRRDGGRALFRLSAETLRRTWFDRVRPGTNVNVERALRAGQPLGGHILQGHVDGVAEVTGPVHPEKGGELRLRLPTDLAKYCVEKGSIGLDGISLTLAAVDGRDVMVAVIPHTASWTTIGRWARGGTVHIEVDVIAKYVEKLVAPYAR